MTDPRDEWITPRQLAAEWQRDVSTIYAKIRRGVIPAHDFDGVIWISRTELDAAMRRAPSARRAA